MHGKGPTLDEYIEARKTALEFEIRAENADWSEPVGEETELYTNKEAAALLDISGSQWFKKRSEAAETDPSLRLPAEKRGRKPLWSRDQVERVRRYIEEND